MTKPSAPLLCTCPRNPPEAFHGHREDCPQWSPPRASPQVPPRERDIQCPACFFMWSEQDAAPPAQAEERKCNCDAVYKQKVLTCDMHQVRACEHCGAHWAEPYAAIAAQPEK